TRVEFSPLTVSTPAPGPLMFMTPPRKSGPLVNLIVPVTPGAKLTMPKPPVSMIAWRSEPGPLSFVFVTVVVVMNANGGAVSEKRAAVERLEAFATRRLDAALAAARRARERSSVEATRARPARQRRGVEFSRVAALVSLIGERRWQ